MRSLPVGCCRSGGVAIAGPLALRITPHGVEAGVAEPKPAELHETRDANQLAPKRPSRRVEAASRKRRKDEAARPSTKPIRQDSKETRVIGMLQRQQGATIAAIMKATGLQQHSVRGFFAGVVRRKLATPIPRP
jgi:hypothetical protein